MIKSGRWISGIHLNQYSTTLPDGTLAGYDAEFGDMFAYEGKLIPKSEWIENLLKADNFEHVSEKNADKTPMRARRNGKNKISKRNTDQFKIPVKYGLKICLYISPVNCINWRPAK
jgi:hypothetical protein